MTGRGRGAKRSGGGGKGGDDGGRRVGDACAIPLGMYRSVEKASLPPNPTFLLRGKTSFL
jgi:hypothetical protein